MRENFEEDLRLYSESSKEKLKEVPPPLLDNPFFKRPPEKEIDEIKDIPKTIYYLQVEKQRIMQKLHRELAALDEPSHVENPEMEKRRGRFVIQKGEKLFWQQKDGKNVALTLGEILTDDSWDIIYNLDQTTVSRATRKRYLIGQAENELRNLYDYQILVQEANNPELDSFKKETYKRIFRDRQNKEIPAGLIVEKMVENFLKKISIDYDVSFKIMPADVDQDVDQKIDFIIHRRRYYRGVGIEADNGEKNDIGVQFTSASHPLKLNEKRHQVARAKEKLKYSDGLVEDIVLVTIPMYKFMGVYDIWKEEKAPGGPDKLWSSEIKKEVFSKILSGILSPQKIETEWQKVQKA